MSNSKNKRKAVLEQNKKNKLNPLSVGIIVILTAVIGFMIYNTLGSSPEQKPQISQSDFNVPAPNAPGNDYPAVQVIDGLVSLDTAQFADGNAKHFTLQAQGKNINFFVIQSSDGVLRCAFDTCDICYAAKKGYRQNGDVMICNNCGQMFPSDRINEEKGGCNPVPLNRSVEGDKLVISASDILAGSGYF